MKTLNPRGFIHIPTLLLVVGAVFIVGITGYFAYKMGQSSGTPVAPNAQATTTIEVATTTATTTTKSKEAETLQKPATTPTTKPATKAVVQTTVTSSVSAPAVSDSGGGSSGSYTSAPLTIDVDHVGQNLYKYDSGIEYGAYGITFDVYAHGGEVLIPLTTTDSSKGNTGVSYSITGDYFGSGSMRDSKFECNLQTTDRGTRYCKVKDGDSTTITITVWLTPYFSGSYGVRFDTLKAWVDGEYKTYPIGEETEKLYIES